MHTVDTPRHLTRVDTETTSAWEGDRVSGMVKLVATGWATGSIPAPPAHGPMIRLICGITPEQLTLRMNTSP